MIGDKKLKTDQGMRSFWHLPGSIASLLSECQFEGKASPNPLCSYQPVSF